MKALLFWSSYIWFPFAVACLIGIWKLRGAARVVVIAMLGLSLPLAWARFVEPQLLFVKEATLDLSGDAAPGPQIRVALFSDTHFGVYKNAIGMERLVKRVQQENVDAVFIAGDFLYELRRKEVAGSLAALSRFSVPIFAVRGNHDVGFPGPEYGMSLTSALDNLGVVLVENRSFEVEIGGEPLVVAGVSDLWARAQRRKLPFKADLPEGVPVVFLTHTPDAALSVPPSFEYDLMLAGHTHGGQIRLPFPSLMRRMIPTRYPFDTGLHVMPDGNLVYVTPGTGMVTLPMRFRRPPRIDILTLTLPLRD